MRMIKMQFVRAAVIVLVSSLLMVPTTFATAVTSRSAIPAGARNVTFSEVALSSGTVVTNQYSFLGVTFSPAVNGVGGWVFSPEWGYPGVDSSDLGNFGGNISCPGPRSILFALPTSFAGFNIVTNPSDSAKLTAKRGGVVVETQIFNTSTDQLYFVGISNPDGFDELVLEIIPDAGTSGSNSCMLMDELAFVGYNACIKDQRGTALFQVNSTTGAYLYYPCGSGTPISGIGQIIPINQCQAMLIDTSNGRAVKALINTCTSSGVAGGNVFQNVTTFFVWNPNQTTSCACQ